MKSNSEGLIIDGVVAYIDRDNIDTDQIIPTEYLKSIKKFGFEDYLFDGWRYKDDGKLGVTKDERVIRLLIWVALGNPYRARRCDPSLSSSILDAPCGLFSAILVDGTAHVARA